MHVNHEAETPLSFADLVTENSKMDECSLSYYADNTINAYINSETITASGAAGTEGPAVSKTLDVLLRDIKMPPKMCKRGRSKGADKTVIGLLNKRKRTSKVIPFADMSVSSKEAILVWLFSPAFVNTVLRGHSIDANDILLHATSLSTSVLDDNVDLAMIRRFFTTEGWSAVKGVVENFKRHVSYICCVCSHDIGVAISICCDRCLLWCHLSCTSLNKPPKKHWFCQTCSAKANV